MTTYTVILEVTMPDNQELSNNDNTKADIEIITKAVEKLDLLVNKNMTIAEIVNGGLS